VKVEEGRPRPGMILLADAMFAAVAGI